MQNLNYDMVRGILFMAIGGALILHLFGFLEKSVTTILFITALYLIISGAYKTGLMTIIQKYLAKKDHD